MNTIKKNNFSYGDFLPCDIAALMQGSLDMLHAFAERAGYQIHGDLPDLKALEDQLRQASASLRKKAVKWHFRLKRRCTLRGANVFLHDLCRKLLEYGPEQAVPRIDYSEKELAIKATRRAWVAARDEAERLRLAYVEEKGDFYKA
jgi:hypothetical protein